MICAVCDTHWISEWTLSRYYFGPFFQGRYKWAHKIRLEQLQSQSKQYIQINSQAFLENLRL